MSDPCREQIVAAVLAALDGITGIRVLREDMDPAAAAESGGDTEEFPQYRIYEADEFPQVDFSGEDAFRLAIDVEIWADGADGAAAMKAVGGFRALADQALLADVTLGGLARNLELSDEAPPMRGAPGGNTVRATSRRYLVDYATREGNPFAFA